MFNPWLVLSLISLYVGLLFIVALWIERGSPQGRRFAENPWVYSFALAVYCTSWTFYGSVGSAASSGMLFLTIYLGPTLAIILWWFGLRKLVRIKSTQRITSIADFISARYGKSQALAAIASMMAIIGATPYIALQLKAILSTFTLVAGSSPS
ncbi:MAG: histidine kinase, partial [Anaerolineae bacterium]|nr:histidine kinase [Anaerolineae bacterium]